MSQARTTVPQDSAVLVLRPVLVVDDSATTRLLIAEILAGLGLGNPVIPLEGGAEALGELQRRLGGDEPLPALVLLDRQMPDVSGVEVLRWMRATPSLAGVPVVMLSGDDTARAVNEAYALGARRYLVKPVGLEVLGAVVRDLELPWVLA